MSSNNKNRVPALRKDSVSGRWVIFSPARAKRPSDFKSKAPITTTNNESYSPNCPFCIGNESMCAPLIFRVPPDPNSDWKIRVIENLYPALDRNLQNDNPSSSGGESLSGFGFHDVVIETPSHSVTLSDLTPHEVGDVLIAYRKRIEQLMEFDSIKYVQVFKNHGASAGASLSHSHSQMIALPVVPPNASARMERMKEHFHQTGKCCLCKLKPNELVIDESKDFIAFVPFAATFAFEIWIAPKGHSSHFHNLDEDKAAEFGGLLKLMLKKISLQLNDPPFNFMIQTSPLQITSLQSPYCHWYLQIVPQLSVVGGFEIGTGCYINPVYPEDAAKILREINVTM